MTKLSKSPYKGTRDFFPEKKRELEFMFGKLSSVAESFGHEPYDGPLLEEVNLYLAKSGEELVNDQIYSFEDRGNRKVAIRPEMTPTLARMVARVHRERPKPFRWYSIPALMRYERPQKGRLREHFQFNCDIFGAPENKGELEILNLLVSTLISFGANESQFKILLNDRRVVDGLFNGVLKLTNEQSYKLYKIVDRLKKVPEDKTNQSIDDLGIDQEKISLLKTYLKINSMEELFSFCKKNGLENSTAGFQEIYNNLKSLSLDKYFTYDPTVVRGLDYYTGLVFECFDLHPDNNRAICGGGSYANLLQIFDEPALPGIGFGLGDVTLSDFLNSHGLMPNFEVPENHIFISYMDDEYYLASIKVAQDLRKNNFKCIGHYEPIKFKKAVNLAEKKGSRFFTLIGQNEIDSKMLNIKDLKSGEQHQVNMNEINEWMRNQLK